MWVIKILRPIYFKHYFKMSRNVNRLLYITTPVKSGNHPLDGLDGQINFKLCNYSGTP